MQVLARIKALVVMILQLEPREDDLLTLEEKIYQSYCWSDAPDLTYEQWASFNGWGRHFTSAS